MHEDAAPIKLNLLGHPRLGESLPVDKPCSLLYYLAYKADWVTRDELAFLYRPDANREVAQAHLRKLIYRVKDLPWSQNLEIERSRLRFSPATDIRAFVEAIDKKAWHRALELYKGELLSGLSIADSVTYTSWLEQERQVLVELWRKAVLAFCREADDQRAQTAHLKALLQTDPLDEEAMQLYIEFLIKEDKRAEALQIFNEFKTLLAKELGIEPLPETLELVAHLESQVEATLPVPATKFIGRDKDVALIEKTLLTHESRLLSVVGVGGLGKTRLALAVGKRLKEQSAVYFIDLSAQTSAKAMSAQIADGMNISLSGQLEPIEHLKRHIGSRKILLILDMFEQLMAAKPLLLDLLETCPNLQLLITSRERLDLEAEWVYQLGGLETPTAAKAQALSMSELLQFDAPALFYQSARKNKLDLRFTDKDTLDLSTICNLVAGSPLGIELAAAWLKMMPLRDVALKLEEGLELFDEASLSNVFERSWHFLHESERELLCKLSVFRGGANLDVIQHLCKAGFTDLERLLDKSFINLSDDGRYDFHPLTREFVKHKAQDYEGTAQMRLEHAKHYLKVLATKGSQLHAHGQLEALEVLERDLANIREAWRRGVHESYVDELFGACEQLYWFFTLQGRFQEALDMTRTALGAFDIQPIQHAGLVGRLLMSEASCLGRMNSSEDAVLVGERSIKVLDNSDDALGKMASRITLAAILWRKGDFEEAHGRIREAKKLMSSSFERRWQGQLLGMQALIEAGLGKPLKAMISFQRALTINRQIGNRMQSVVALYGVGNALLDAGKSRQAESMLTQALRLAEETEYQAFQAVIMTSLAQLKLKRRHYKQVQSLAQRILQDTSFNSDQVAEADAYILLGRLSIAQGELEEGKAQLMQGLTLGIDVQNQVTNIRALLGFAEYHLQQGEVATALQLISTILVAAPSFEKAQAEKLLKSIKSDAQADTFESLDEAVEQVMVDNLEVLAAQL